MTAVVIVSLATNLVASCVSIIAMSFVCKKRKR